jgi:hypothetical protein
MVNRRAGIVAQARQREIDAAGVEVGKRIVFRRMKQAIGGFIANLRQLGGGEKRVRPALIERSSVSSEPSITYG